MNLFNPNLNPYYQPAFILETTSTFYEEGLSASAYYHIRDYYVDPLEFNFLSKRYTLSIMDMFNLMPYLGLYDNQGRARPSYYVFQCLSQQKGSKLEIKGTNEDIKSFTTLNREIGFILYSGIIPEEKRQRNTNVILHMME